MKTTIESVFRVTPEVFWQRLFFDEAYNAGLYGEMSFESYEVLAITRHPDGRVERRLKAEPPINGPELVKRHLRGRIHYIEDGTYDPSRGTWEFVNQTNVKTGSTRISGTLRALPHPEGMRQVVDLEISVSMLGLGSLVERTIEKNARASYEITANYTNRYAAMHGLLAP